MHNKGGRKFSNKFVSKTEVSIETAITKLSKKYGSIDLLTAAIMRNNNLSYEKASEIAERLNSSDYLFDRLIDNILEKHDWTEEEALLYNLGIIDKSEDLSSTDFAVIASFCHIHTDKTFMSFASLKDKGLIDYKETRKTIKNVRFTEQGRCVLEEMKRFHEI